MPVAASSPSSPRPAPIPGGESRFSSPRGRGGDPTMQARRPGGLGRARPAPPPPAPLAVSRDQLIAGNFGVIFSPRSREGGGREAERRRHAGSCSSRAAAAPQSRQCRGACWQM